MKFYSKRAHQNHFHMTGQHFVRAILMRLSLSLKKIKTSKTPHVQQEFTYTRSNTPWLRSLNTKLWRLQRKMDFDWKLLYPKIFQPQCSHDNTNWTSGWAYFQWPCMNQKFCKGGKDFLCYVLTQFLAWCLYKCLWIFFFGSLNQWK